jgi:rhodanese-related sulfurtransferase
MTILLALFVLFSCYGDTGDGASARAETPSKHAASALVDYMLWEDLDSLLRANAAAPESERIHLVDVRTPEEFESGAIPGAVNIPVATLPEGFPVKDRQAPIVVYCRSGRRSQTAKQLLMEAGYVRVVDFGGIGRWRGPIEPGLGGD